MFDSRERLAAEIEELLHVLRGVAGGRYACLVDRERILFEAPDGVSEVAMLRGFLRQRTAALFAIPESMAGDGPSEDLFAGWDDDAFFLAFINGRVGVVVACPEPEGMPEKALRPLRALTDRLFRWNQAWRVDRRGRGFFFGRPKLDLVVVGRPQT